MKTEIDHGVEFLGTLLMSNGADEGKSRKFCNALHRVLSDQFAEHWDLAHPTKGSGYRCIRLHHDRCEPMVDRACLESNTTGIVKLLPSELTLWVDPANVCYRIGESSGRIKTIYCAGAKDRDMTAPAAAVPLSIPQQQQQSNGISGHSPPHTPQHRTMLTPPLMHQQHQQHTQNPQPQPQRLHSNAPVYVPDSTHSARMGGRQTPVFTPRSPSPRSGAVDFSEIAYAQLHNPYSKQSHAHHNPHTLLMAAR